LYQGLVKGRELALNVDSLYGLTSEWEYNGPTLYTVFALYKPDTDAHAIVRAVDEEIARIVSEGVDDATLARTRTALLADWYNGMEPFISRADTLAKLQLLWGDAGVANRIPDWIEAVTSADVQRAARTYLVAPNRTVIDRVPAAPLAARPDDVPQAEGGGRDEADDAAVPPLRLPARRARPAAPPRGHAARPAAVRARQAAAGAADRAPHPRQRAGSLGGAARRRAAGGLRAGHARRGPWRRPGRRAGLRRPVRGPAVGRHRAARFARDRRGCAVLRRRRRRQRQQRRRPGERQCADQPRRADAVAAGGDRARARVPRQRGGARQGQRAAVAQGGAGAAVLPCRARAAGGHLRRPSL